MKRVFRKVRLNSLLKFALLLLVIDFFGCKPKQSANSFPSNRVSQNQRVIYIQKNDNDLKSNGVLLLRMWMLKQGAAPVQGVVVSGQKSSQTKFHKGEDSEYGLGQPAPEGIYHVNPKPEEARNKKKLGKSFYRISFDDSLKLHDSKPRQDVFGIHLDADHGDYDEDEIEKALGDLQVQSSETPVEESQESKEKEKEEEVAPVKDQYKEEKIESADELNDSFSLVQDSESAKSEEVNPGTHGSLAFISPADFEKFEGFIGSATTEVPMVIDYGQGTVEKPKLYLKQVEGQDIDDLTEAFSNAAGINSGETFSEEAIPQQDGKFICNLSKLKLTVNWGGGFASITKFCTEDGTHLCEKKEVMECAGLRQNKTPKDETCDISDYCQAK